MDTIKLDFIIGSSRSILFRNLSTPEGLSDWFADKVDIVGNKFIFEWDEEEQREAELIYKKDNEEIHFKWLDGEGEFKFILDKDGMTNELILVVEESFYMDDDDQVDNEQYMPDEGDLALWEKLISRLRISIGAR
ncbi:MAG: START-like domain-containing protein [Marinifilaceae bacterium]|jgi:uncharacterized protein YndB with AHSA1/START domain|nr:START-like domain-containing protein [Marinifilaceae bacterium]